MSALPPIPRRGFLLGLQLAIGGALLPLEAFAAPAAPGAGIVQTPRRVAGAGAGLGQDSIEKGKMAAQDKLSTARSDVYRASILVRDAPEDPGLRRRDLEIDLVRLQLDERVPGGHRVSFLFKPLGDTRVDDRLADFGNDDIYRHRGSNAEIGNCELGIVGNWP